MIRTAATVTGAALAVTLLSGCAGSPGAGGPPTTPVAPTTHRPSTAPTTRATSPTPTDPTQTAPLPPQAREKSIAGAKAFVRFYIDGVNRAWHAPSGALPRRFSTPGCISCRGMATSMDQIRGSHGFSRGGDWIITSITAVPHQPAQKPILHTAITIEPGVWKRNPTDHLRHIKAGKMYVDVHLVWSDSTWLVSSMVLA